MRTKAFLFPLLLLSLLLTVIINPDARSQSAGDYRSVTTGTWITLATWQRFDGSSWITPTSGQGYPGQYTGTQAVTIRAGHVVTIAAAISTQPMGALTIQSTGQVYLAGSNSQVIFALDTPEINIISGGSIYFSNKARLVLTTNAVVTLAIGQGGLLGSCNNNDEILIGTILFAACAGAPGNVFTYAQLMAMGGTLNSIPSSNSPVCQGSTINLSGTYAGAYGTAPAYSWSVTAPGGGVSTYSTQNVTIPSAVTGTYSATLTVSTVLSGTTYTNAETLLVTVNPLPTLTSASQAITVCSGSPATINLGGLVPSTTFTLNYKINNVTQSPATGLVSGAGGTSVFSTPALTAANNGQTLQITGITITSSPTSCAQSFARDVTLSVWTTGPGTWTGTTNGDWNTPTNWCGGIVPTSVTDVRIPAPSASVLNQPAISATGGSCRNITIDPGASLTLGGTANLNVTGNWTNNGSFSAGTATVTFNGTTAAQVIAGTTATTFYNLVVNNTFPGGGVSATTDMTVNGTLNLQAPNPSATRGCLDLAVNWGNYPADYTGGFNVRTLNLGANASTTGSGDVTGILRRTSPSVNTAYTYGNAFTTLAFANLTGSLPSAVTMTIKIGVAPQTPGVQRLYEMVPENGNGCTVNMNFHYLDSELNGNTENKLVTADYDIGPTGSPVPDEHGRSAYDFTNNYIGLSNVVVEYFIQSYRTIFFLRDYQETHKTWNGSQTGADAGNWFAEHNWTPSGVPGIGDFVLIPAGSSPYPVLQNYQDPSINLLTVEAGASLDLGNNGCTFTIQNGLSGGWEDQAGGVIPGNSTVIFLNPGATVSGTANFNNIQINNGADITVQNGTVMRIAGTVTRNGSGKLYADIYDNTIEYNAPGNQDVIVPDGDGKYRNLALSGSGTKTLPTLTVHGNVTLAGTAGTSLSSLTITGNLILGNGTTFTAGNLVHNLGGNFINNGGSFINTGSTLNFNGNALQSIGGTTSTTFNNLTVSNAAGISLDLGETVNGTLDLSGGTVTTGSNILSVGATGSIANPSSSGFVNGKLARVYTGTGSKQFPVGKGGNYRPLSLNYTSLTGTPSTVTAEQFESTIPGSNPLDIVPQPGRYWTISESGSTSRTYLLTLNGSPFNPGTSTTVILKGNGTSNTAFNATYSSPDFTTVSGLTDFSNFAVASDCPLPAIVGQPASPVLACAGTGTPSFTVNASGSSLSYRWQESTTGISGSYNDISDGGVYSGATGVTLTLTNPPYSMNGNYYRVLVTLSCGSSVTSNPALLTVRLLPQGSLSANGPFCGSGTGQLTWTATAGTGRYTIVYNDGTSDRTASDVESGTPFDVASNPVSSSASYSLVSVTGNNGAGCSRSAGFTGGSASITVMPLPDGTLSGNAICAGETGQFTFAASSGTGPFTLVINGTTYSSVYSNVPFNANPNPSGTTSYTLSSVSDATGCNKTVGIEGPAASIIVYALPSFTVTPADVTCYAGANGQISVTASGGTGPWSYSTDNGASYTPDASNPHVFTGLLPATYNIRVMDSFGCQSATCP
jgi:hypothetical protein